MKKVILILSILSMSVLASKEARGMNGLNARERDIDRYLNGAQFVGETSKAEQIYTEINQRHLLKVQPPVQLDWSLERDQINRRTLLWNDKNKVSYIYLFNKDALIGFYAVKGKVSSVNSSITSPNMVYNGATLDSPSEDGSYGTNGDAVFFFLTDGTYMEWNGTYLLVDKPMKLGVKPLIYEEDK